MFRRPSTDKVVEASFRAMQEAVKATTAVPYEPPPGPTRRQMIMDEIGNAIAIALAIIVALAVVLAAAYVARIGWEAAA